MFRLFKQGNAAKLVIAITTSQFSTGAKFTASNIKATFYKLNGTNDDLEIDTDIGASGIVTLTADKLGKAGWHAALIDFSAITAKQYIVVFEATIDSVNAIAQEFLDVSAELARLAGCALEATSQLLLVDTTDIKDVGLGKWVVDPDAGTLTLYRIDGITVLKVFDLTESSDIIPAYVARVPDP